MESTSVFATTGLRDLIVKAMSYRLLITIYLTGMS
jgi:hypothetical protein